jgi:uncharacterized PurR-regulated membrane protein YhhQ (DUF165 family)
MLQSKKETVYIISRHIHHQCRCRRVDWRKINSRWSLPMSVGILPWPIVFVTTDLINEYFGEKAFKSYR